MNQTKSKSISKADYLNAIINISGIIISSILSIWISRSMFTNQEISTRSLEAKLRYSEISTDLHTRLRNCKDNIRSVSIKIKKDGFQSYLKHTNNTVVDCRSNLLPFIASLKIFDKDEFGYNERKYLLKIDNRMYEFRNKIAELIRQDKPLEIYHYQEINSLLLSLVNSNNKNLATLDELENMLINN